MCHHIYGLNLEKLLKIETSWAGMNEQLCVSVA